MQEFAPNLWITHFPFSMLGGHQGRVVTVIRLASGRLIIQSTTGPFSSADVAAIRARGTPGWFVDSMLKHDTFAQEGRRPGYDPCWMTDSMTCCRRSSL